MSNSGEPIYLTDGSTCIVVRVGGSGRLSMTGVPAGCGTLAADEDWGMDQDGSAVGRNPDGSTSISMGTCGTSTPGMPNVVLPVELISFNGKVINNTVHLAWKTASEIENSHFEIERSPDGKNFKGIGKVKGNGTTLEAQYYSFEDKTFSKGLNYYRLKQIDFDGDYEYSEIVVLRSEQGKEQIFFSPNPTNIGQVRFSYNSPRYGKLHTQVLDLSGKVLLDYDLQVVEGNNTLELDLNTLSKGMYFVRLKQEGIERYEKVIIE